MANITNSVVTKDQEKFLAAKLIDRSLLKVVMANTCDTVTMPEGAGTTAYMVRYKRMNVPMSTLTEGTAPTESTFSLEEVTVTLDQWGDYIAITDVAQLTAKHPLVQEAVKLLADNAARVMDREVTNVYLSGTNVQYADGSVTSRSALTADLEIDDSVIDKARVKLVSDGTPPIGGPSGDARQMAARGNFMSGNEYLAICGPEVIADIMAKSSSYGTWVSVATYQNANALYRAEVGMWRGFRWVETNFIPKFVQYGNTTTAVTSTQSFGTGTPSVTALTSGGNLANATHHFKVVRKNKLRGFSEEISSIHTQATGATSAGYRFSFTTLSTDYLYDIYFATEASVTSESTLRLAASNIAGGTTAVDILSLASGTAALAPQSLGATNAPSAVHPIFVLGEAATAWVGFYDIKMYYSSNKAEKSDPLNQYRTIGYKFYGKAVIKDQLRLLRIEVASKF